MIVYVFYREIFSKPLVLSVLRSFNEGECIEGCTPKACTALFQRPSPALQAILRYILRCKILRMNGLEYIFFKKIKFLIRLFFHKQIYIRLLRYRPERIYQLHALQDLGKLYLQELVGLKYL